MPTRARRPGGRLSEAVTFTGANECRVATGDGSADSYRLVAFVVGDQLSHSRAVGPTRDERRRLVAGREHVQAGRHDLGGAPVVHREANDLDAGEAFLDIDEQRGIGTIEAVDGLCRIADQEQIVAACAE
jgi:hypothetical protein